MTSGRATGAAGFTLIELLCALAILALVLDVALRILSGGLAGAQAVDHYSRAVATAESHLAALMAAERPTAGERHGVEDGLTWDERVAPATEPVFAAAPKAGLTAWAVSVRVAAADGRAVLLQSVKLVRAP